MKSWTAEAPSNIALIKYMGKTAATENRPTNASLSMTLNHLRTRVEVQCRAELNEDQWKSLDIAPWNNFSMSPKGVEKFLNHWRLLKSEMGLEGNFLIQSGNNFPSDCGIASSASAFAALTLAGARVATDLGQKRRDWTMPQLSAISRKGSGSSCRSFFSPWAIWRDEGAHELELSLPTLHHQVILADVGKKSVSSSEAHARVTNSLLFAGRPERAERRLVELVSDLREGNWSQAQQICWEEFWDMHALFETARPHFSYITARTMEVLNFAREIWSRGDGPLVTLDAGPNVHLLYRQDQAALAREIGAYWSSKVRVISSEGLML